MDAFTASGLDRREIGLTIMNDDELYPLNYYLGLFGGNGPSFSRLGSFVSEGPQAGLQPHRASATSTRMRAWMSIGS
jgi:hypothetical protein